MVEEAQEDESGLVFSYRRLSPPLVVCPVAPQSLLSCSLVLVLVVLLPPRYASFTIPLVLRA